MKPINGKVLIKITKQQWETLFVKRIKRDDGTYCHLFTNVEAGETDDRRYILNIQNAEIVSIPNDIDGMGDIKIGDIALIDHLVSNDDEINLIEKNDQFELRCINAVTTIHQFDEVVYANRKSQRPKDQVIARKGDYNEISPLLGIIRGEQIMARFPYVFLHHESNVISKVSAAGLLYEETQHAYERQILSSGDEYYQDGETVFLRDIDVFPVKAGDRKFDCVFSKDIQAKKSWIDTYFKKSLT